MRGHVIAVVFFFGLLVQSVSVPPAISENGKISWGENQGIDAREAKQQSRSQGHLKKTLSLTGECAPLEEFPEL